MSKKEVQVITHTESIPVIQELPPPVSARHNIQYMPLSYRKQRDMTKWHIAYVSAAVLVIVVAVIAVGVSL